MKKWTLLEHTTTKDGGRLTLNERDGLYLIRLDGVDLMSTRESFSERKLAEHGCQWAKFIAAPRILIGGLGLGFTLRATLELVEKKAQVVVVELSSEVIAWNGNLAYPLAGKLLKDSRVRLKQMDVRQHVAKSKATYDAILLDVDNGPTALTVASNSGLYDKAGIESLKRALKPKGRLAVWSVDESPPFIKRLKSQGFKTLIERVRAHETSGGWRTLFLADL